MTKPDGVAPEPKGDGASPSWGTWEELILAFAVNRHGTGSWESIASELQKRASGPNLSLTAQNCRLKYLDLKRRFVVAPNGDSDGGGKSGVEESAAPLLEELRKLRVAELRREVQRYDLNIESLELKVKRMEEEREKSLMREKTESDLENKSEEERIHIQPPASGGQPVVGHEMDKDQLSVNESNSTDPEAEKLRTGEKEAEPAGTGLKEVRQDRTRHTSEKPAALISEPDRKSVREDSCNGSSNSIEKSGGKAKIEPVTDSADLVESDSDGGKEAAKENSDVQSTASRSRKEEGSDKVRRGSTKGHEREHVDQYRAVKGLSAESQQPLFEFLQAIRAHKLGSVLERRLRSQETSKYQKLILQHIDLETVETRLKQGWYSASRIEFYRDLLLLVNNALVFFPKNSPEANAADVIRTLVSKNVSNNKNAKSGSSSGKQISLQSLSTSKKDEPETPHSLMLKPKISGSLIVCRKRSSIAAKSSDNKKGQTSSEKDLKVPSDHDAEEPKITKKRTRDDRFCSPPPLPPVANTKKNNGKNNQASSNAKQHGKGVAGGSPSEMKIDNRKTAPESKKQGAADFLNRMKQGPSSVNNGVLVDALKNTPLIGEGNAGGKGGTEQKKSENPKRGEKKEQVTRRSTAETRQTKEKEKGSPGKRNVGRPPKRGPPPPPQPLAAGKRSRERSEAETPPAKQQPKKRRKL